MVQKVSPFLESKYGWDFGESGWNSGMDENLLKFSFLFDGNIDSIVSTLPPAVRGQSHFLTTDNRLYFSVNSQWYSCPTSKWKIITIKDTGEFFQFNGTSLVQIDNPNQLDSRLEAVELTISSLGSAAFQNGEYFATQASLDVVEASLSSDIETVSEGVIAAEERFERELFAAGYTFLGNYTRDLNITTHKQYFRRGDRFYAANEGTTLPYTTTGDWTGDSAEFKWLGDDMLRQDLAGSILDGKGALLVKGAVPHVAVLSDLNALPLVASQTCNVSGHNVPGVGGGIFTYYPEMPWSEHDGGVVIASGALSTWSGSEADLSALLSFSGTGTGCWARQVDDQSEYVVTWFGTTGTAQDTDLLAFNAAKSSKLRRSGGGVVRVPVGDYQFIDEFVCADFVQFVGEHRRLCRIVGKAGLGAGKAVVRACKLPVGSAEIPEYMSYTGFANCTINGSATWDIGLYVRHCTNESVFDDVTVQNCKTANSNFIGVFYVSVKNHVSRDARDRGVVVGQKLYSEGGYGEVNFTAFNNLRGNYAGLDDAYHPVTAPYKGACVTIWSANACAFDIVAGENAYGVGVVIRRGVNSVIPNIYVEANGKGTNAATAVGVRVINADFAVLKIGVLEATRNQKIHLESGVVIDVDEIYSETFSEGLFEGTGSVVLNNGHNVNLLTATDRQRVINITRRIFSQFNNVPFSNFSSLDNSTTYFPESTSDVRVAIVPKVSVTTADPIQIGLSDNAAGGQELNFGTSFSVGVPVVRKFNSVGSGFFRLTHRSNSLPSSATGIAFDIVVLQPRCQHRVVFGTDL